MPCCKSLNAKAELPSVSAEDMQSLTTVQLGSFWRQHYSPQQGRRGHRRDLPFASCAPCQRQLAALVAAGVLVVAE